jgi:hypothetical protein
MRNKIERTLFSTMLSFLFTITLIMLSSFNKTADVPPKTALNRLEREPGRSFEHNDSSASTTMSDSGKRRSTIKKRNEI